MGKPRVHALVSGCVAAAMWAKTRNPRVPLAVMATGVLIDADHLVDLADFRLSGGVRRTLLPLHGWEYLLLLWWLGKRVFGRQVALGLCAGYAVHLVLDQILNKPRNPLTYSAVFRALHGFYWKRFWPPEHTPGEWMTESPVKWF